MAKFRSWNEELKCFIFFEDGYYTYFENGSEQFFLLGYDFNDLVKRGGKHYQFNWQTAEQIIEPIDVDENALGCGLEDLNINDRYDAMMYGFNQALELIENELNIHYEGK